MRGIISTLSFVVSIIYLSNATHNRAGEMTFKYVGINTYKITLNIYTKTDAPPDRPFLPIWWGDNTSDSIPRILEINLPNNITKNSYNGTHTYPGPGKYFISMTDPNRNGGIINIPVSDQVSFYLESMIWIIPNLSEQNNSPELRQAPIDFANRNQIFIHNPIAIDPDGDSLSYELVIPKTIGGQNVPGWEPPDSFPPGINNITSIDAATGDYVWDAPQQIGEYNVAILIKEYRNGFMIGSTLRDMQITVVDIPNNPPVIANINDTCIIAGDSLTILVTATDPDFGQQITLTAQGNPFEVSSSPAQFDSATGFSPVASTFRWQTTCDHITDQSYSVVFRAEDNYTLGPDPYPLVDFETWIITVVAPAPKNLQAAINGDDIVLTWDSIYQCASIPNFKGFSIWRKEGSNPFTPDTCETGLAGKGYTKIAQKITNYTYIDKNLDAGKLYCYRIIAEFHDGSDAFPYHIAQSLPSNEICFELKRDAPIITNISVTNTDNANGKIFVRWSKPLIDSLNLDTIQNPGPYKFKIYRSPNFFGSSYALIDSFTGNYFATFNDTTYTDSLINTVDIPYSYKIGFYANNDNIFVGETADTASSVFLSITPTDNQLDLAWEEHVPWINQKYYIYKSTVFAGPYSLIDSSTTQSYSDVGLVNGNNYCYYIESYGSYSAPGLPNPILNASQIKCSIPVDNIPPCPPTLSISNYCDILASGVSFPPNYQNTLTWNNPNNSCADDVETYNIYFGSTETTPMVILTTINLAADTTYTHENLNSLAGCYTVTAIDSYSNESQFSNIVCIDNCPEYELPNVFTPNNDGSNDIFKPFPYRFVDHVDMKIYNRWGELVFKTTAPDINWDGREIQSGKMLSEGVYFYTCDIYEIRISGIKKSKTSLTGFIRILSP